MAKRELTKEKMSAIADSLPIKTQIDDMFYTIATFKDTHNLQEKTRLLNEVKEKVRWLDAWIVRWIQEHAITTEQGIPKSLEDTDEGNIYYGEYVMYTSLQIVMNENIQELQSTINRLAMEKMMK